MHDRRIDGQETLFGNAGGLYMRAMTWYDHTTSSIWSQPWGRAISGPLAGTELALLPSQVTIWRNWERQHPETLALVNDTDRIGRFREGFDPDFVIGVVIGDEARAYCYRAVEEAGIVSDQLGDLPVVIWAADGEFRAYFRRVGDRVLNFRLSGESLIDVETGTRWDVRLGLAVAGDLAGAALQQAPGLTSSDWAWLDFYPDSKIYGAD